MSSTDFLDPTGGLEVPTYDLAPRLRTLEGTQLGILDNSKTNAEKFLRMVADLLIDEYGVAELQVVRKEALSKPALEGQLKDLSAQSDFVITGTGDCGSCSTNSVHDGIELEKLGVPAVAICTEVFVPGLEALAGMRGMANYPLAVVPHPLGVLFDDELYERAKLAAPQVVDIVLRHEDRPES